MSKKHPRNLRYYFGKPVWRNSVRDLRIHPLKYYKPRNIEDLKDIITRAIEEEAPVRAVGAGHSYSLACHTDGFLIETYQLNKVIGKYRFADDPLLIEVEGGITVHHLNEQLDEMDLSIVTMGGIDHQTVAGAISTGTHGSSLGFGAMSKMVESIVLVTTPETGSEAAVYRIEKTAGPTDPAKYPLDEPALIQDDDLFNSVLVSFGTMGIIYSLVLRVEKQFYLEECRKVQSWQEVQDELKNSDLLTRHHSLFIQINPYKEKNDDRSCLVSYHNITEPISKQKQLQQDAKKNIWYRIDKAIRNPVSQLLGNIPGGYWLMIFLINKYPDRVPKLVNRAINNQQDKSYINKAHKVMYQGLDRLKEKAYDAEFAVEVEGNKYLTVVNELMTLIEDIYARYKLQISSPIGLRFVKASDAYLTPEYQKDVCYIDAPVLKHAYGNDIILLRIQQLLKEHKARPHWGKKNENINREYIHEVYPAFPNWYEHYQRFNKNGIFSNQLTKQLIE